MASHQRLSIQFRWLGYGHQLQDGGHNVEDGESGLRNGASTHVDHGIVEGVHPYQLIALVGEHLFVERAFGILAIEWG